MLNIAAIIHTIFLRGILRGRGPESPELPLLVNFGSQKKVELTGLQLGSIVLLLSPTIPALLVRYLGAWEDIDPYCERQF